MKRVKPKVLIPTLSLLVLFAIFSNLSIGAYQISISELISTFTKSGNVNPITQSIVFDIRIPRLLLGIAIGIALASATTLMQSSMRNVLADPALLGLASASALGVVVALVLGFDFGGIAAFAFALAFTVVSFLLLLVGHFGGKRASAQNTLLIGVALGAFFLGLLGVLATSLDNPQLRAMTLWSFGTLALATQTIAAVSLTASVIGFALVWILAPKMDLLLLGERMAKTLGVETRKLRSTSLLLISLLVTAAVYGAGVIAFLGLFAVTVARALVGPRHRLLLLTGSLISVLTLLICDLLARTIAAPIDLPIGFLTSLIGAPVLIFILARSAND